MQNLSDLKRGKIKPNKAFKSDSQRSAFSLRSSIAERSSHLNAALAAYKFACSISCTSWFFSHILVSLNVHVEVL